jgi:hypothetical protein
MFFFAANEHDSLSQIFFCCLNQLPLPVGTWNFWTDRPIAIFRRLFNDCCKISTEIQSLQKPSRSVKRSLSIRQVISPTPGSISSGAVASFLPF